LAVEDISVVVDTAGDEVLVVEDAIVVVEEMVFAEEAFAEETTLEVAEVVGGCVTLVEVVDEDAFCWS
jgi:hypothetical protein